MRAARLKGRKEIMHTKVLFCLLSALLLAPVLQAESAGVTNPHLAKAIELRVEARKAYDTGDYDTATELARQAKAELALIQGKAKATLPASYTVRLIPNDRDCLSKIAGYPFVYGDRSQWVQLYRANKATLKHPEDADLILPGEVLVIPSIAGEKRQDEWAEGKDYSSFSK
jgi:nucleoid-associated protein YgaU